jgi:glycosyltransferase involved in cell wall biosynthesis
MLVTVDKPQVQRQVLDGIAERAECGLRILSPANGHYHRRLLYVNSYGGGAIVEKIKRGTLPPHHLWGCFELVRRGYEVALAEPLRHFYLYRNPFPHDLRLLRVVRSWLGRDGIVYCGHNVLYWLPFLRALGALRCHIVSLLFAREPLAFGRGHRGVIALTPAAAEQARKLAPNAKVAHLGWGADLSVYPDFPYRPEAFLSCGIACRDFATLSIAAGRTKCRINVVVPGPVPGVTWPPNVLAIDSGKGWSFEKKRLSYQELLNDYYARSAASVIAVRHDPKEYIACGFTELLEAMAMARPVIMTKTGALPTEIDIEHKGFGIFVPPTDPDVLADAINYLAENSHIAEAMGRKGRALAESYYNIERYATGLNGFFECI